MFGIWKKKSKPTRYLIGKVRARYKSNCDPNKTGEFMYKLYTDSNGKRLYEIVITNNHDVLYSHYAHNAHAITYHEYIATNHKSWYTVVKPWLDGEEDLNPRYHVDGNNMTSYISNRLCVDITHYLNSIELAGTNVEAIKKSVEGIRSIMSKAIKA